MGGFERISRYSRWDGSQKVDLRWEKLVDDLLDKFLQTGEITSAMEWLLRQGHRFKEGATMQGLNQILENLMKMRRQLLSDYNVSNLTDQMREKLDEILDMEKEAIQSEFDKSQSRYNASGDSSSLENMQRMFGKEDFLNNLPPSFKESVEKLKDYNWQSPEAREKFEELTDIIRQIQDVVSRNWFTGDTPMSLEETVEAVERLQKIADMVQALEQGRLMDVKPADLEELLGEEARQSLEMMLQFIEFLHNEGYVRQAEDDWELTPKAINRIARKALKDIYSAMEPGTFGRHETRHRGVGEPVPDQPRQYRFGDPMHVDMKATLMESMTRKGSAGVPLRMEPDDIMVADTEYRTATATALLLDMSLSMVREGRFAAAKKVAIALNHMIKDRFPGDIFFVVGFATVARRLRGAELANAKGAMGGDIFTNIQDALRLSSRLLDRTGSKNKQILLVTDGQPTAYTTGGELHVEWPVFGTSPNAARETLKEVKRVTSQKTVINTFMLDASPELMQFVDEMTRINRGRAFYTTPDKLGQYLLIDFVKGRKKRLQ